MGDARFYNVQILRVYLSFLKQKLAWRDDSIDKFLDKLKISKSFLQSDENWFDQELADTFYFELIKLTGDNDLAYKVGQYVTAESTSGLNWRIVRGILSPSMVFRHIGSIGSAYSKGATYETVGLSGKSATIRCMPVSGCEEKQYQCWNRMGMFQSIPIIFGSNKTSVTHSQCFHRGDSCCEYVITWNRDSKRIGIGFITIATISVICIAALTLRSQNEFRALAVISALCSWAVYRELANRFSKKNFSEQNSALIESVAALDRRREEAALVRRISKMATEILSENELSFAIVESVRIELKVDRVIILKVNYEKNVLYADASSGYDGESREIVNQMEFGIRADNNAGYFVSVVNSKKPIFVTDVSDGSSKLSLRSQKILQALGTRSFIAVPIVFKDKVLGVIAVENLKSGRNLTTQDLDLLNACADNLAVAISNARHFDAMKSALKREQLASEQQSRLKDAFRKYVPSGIQSKIASGSAIDRSLAKEVLTIMFIDIFGFSKLSEEMPPEHLADLLNIYFEHVAAVVEQFGGTINKFLGDGLLIHFNSRQRNGILAALKIREAIAKTNEELFRKNYPSIKIGIGIHKGSVIIGNIGSPDRLDYTIIGDSVNIAARLEQYTRNLGPNTICFSSSLSDEAEEIPHKMAGEIQLKGKSQKVSVLYIQCQSEGLAA